MADKETMYVRRKEDQITYEFIDDREVMDAEGTKFMVKKVLKEDKKADIIEAISILKKQIEDKVLEGEVAKFEKQLALIEAYEEANPIEQVLEGEAVPAE